MVSKEKRLFRERVRSLKDKLAFTEPFTIMYSGGTPAFVEYSRIIRGNYSIPMIERGGSIAGIVKRELTNQFAKEDIPQWQRYCLGRVLRFTPEQIHIMHKDIGQYFKFVERETSLERGFKEEVRLRKQVYDYKRACEEFEKMFPQERASYFFAVLLELNSSRNAYDIRVLSQPYKEFLLKDPITPEKIDQLHEHLVSLAGERSKKLMLGSAA